MGSQFPFQTQPQKFMFCPQFPSESLSLDIPLFLFKPRFLNDQLQQSNSWKVFYGIEICSAQWWFDPLNSKYMCLTASPRGRLTGESLLIQLSTQRKSKTFSSFKRHAQGTDLHCGDGASVLMRCCWLLPCYYRGHSVWRQRRYTWQTICIQDRHGATRDYTSTFSCQVNSTFCETNKQKTHYRSFTHTITLLWLF